MLELGAASALSIFRGFGERIVAGDTVGSLDILGFVMVPFFYMVTRAG